MHVPKENRKKLDSKTTKCLFLGLDNETKAYRLYDQGRWKVIISRDVVFDETKVSLKYLDTDEPDEIVFQNTETVDTEPNDQTEPHTPDPMTQANTDSQTNEQPAFPEHGPSGLSDDLSSSLRYESMVPETAHNSLRPSRSVDPVAEPPSRRYPIRHRTPSVQLRDFWSLYSELLEEPLDFATANAQEDWKKAIKSETDSILKNDTWTVIDRSNDRKPITAKWLFKIKRNSSGKISKLKARIVARGFQQKEGVDYHDVFAPVVKWSTILAISTVAAQQKWSLRQMDVITAFMNGTISEEILMEIPDGFLGVDDPTKICKINRALYGLKQAPKAWYDRINKWLHEAKVTPIFTTSSMTTNSPSYSYMLMIC